MIEAYEIREAAPTLLALGIMELLFSLDRLIQVSDGVARLPEPKRALALRLGSWTADFARLGGLVVAVPLISLFRWAQILGALYLLYLMSAHFVGRRTPGVPSGNETASTGRAVLEVALLDLSLSVGNIVAALTLTRQVWIIWLSVIFWMSVTRIFRKPLLQLTTRLPQLTSSVPFLTGGIGVLLLVEILARWKHLPTTNPEQKLLGLAALVLLSALYTFIKPLQSALSPLFKTVGSPLAHGIHSGLSLVFSPLGTLLRRLLPR
jgi:predicted tellurium resistance membrane protein TerC